MELENIVANTQYLKAMEGKGRSKKWRDMLKFPLVCNLGPFESKMRQSGELSYKTVCRLPIGKLEFQQFCEYTPYLMKPMELQTKIAKFHIAVDTERGKIAHGIVNTLLSPLHADLAHLPSDEVDRLVNVIEGASEYPSDIFQSLFDRNDEFLQGLPFAQFQVSPWFSRYLQWMWLQKIPIDKDRIRLYRVLGKGGFGEVYACQKRDTGMMYAVKCLDKKRIKKKKAESLAWNERDLLESIDSRFVCGLKYAYEMKDALCMVLDLMGGGDLQYHLRQQGTFNEERTRFYAAEMTLGLQHIHKAGVVYRDMKPENMLVDKQGHLRISDLGLAVRINKKKGYSKGRVGTPGYMAPEVIRGEHYGFGVDWWGLGCCIYDMLEGHGPFRKNREKVKLEKLQKRALEGEILFSDRFSPAAKDIASQFLIRDPAQRLGVRKKGGHREIHNHPFFAEIDWARLEAGVVTPPFIPSQNTVNAKDVLDIDRFDSIKDVKLTSTDTELYARFPVVVSKCWQQEMVDTVFNELNPFDPQDLPYELDPANTEEAPKTRTGLMGLLLGKGGPKKDPNKPPLTFSAPSRDTPAPSKVVMGSPPSSPSSRQPAVTHSTNLTTEVSSVSATTPASEAPPTPTPEDSK